MRKLFLFFVFLVALLTIGFVWWKSELQPVNSTDTIQEKFVVSSGEGVRTIAEHLKSAGLIRNQWAFFLLIKEIGLSGKLQAGEFQLSPSLNARQIADQLKTGTFDVWVSIPEGKRAEEIASLLQQQLPSYQDSWRTLLQANEGYLFPAKYRFPRDASVNLVVSTMRKEFEANYSRIAEQNTGSLSKQDIVTIASIIEREAMFPVDRPLVASVILNRLKINMALQLDSTVEYAMGYQKDLHSWWKSVLATEDTRINSPYNTYLNLGLPPTPISNPGYDALAAVVSAPNTPYLYYVSDATGHTFYATTLDEHNANVAKHMGK